jgi:hypothetical protein
LRYWKTDSILCSAKNCCPAISWEISGEGIGQILQSGLHFTHKKSPEERIMINNEWGESIELPHRFLLVISTHSTAAKILQTYSQKQITPHLLPTYGYRIKIFW